MNLCMIVLCVIFFIESGYAAFRAVDRERKELFEDFRTAWGNKFKDASEELRDNEFVVMAAIRKNDYLFRYASERLRKDKEFVMMAVRESGFVLDGASSSLREDEAFIMAAVKVNGAALQGASEDLQDNKRIVLAAVADFYPALHYASRRLRQDKEVVMVAALRNRRALQYASRNLKETLEEKDFVLKLVAKDGLALRYFSDTLRYEREVAMTAIIQNSDVYHEITDFARKSTAALEYRKEYEAWYSKQDISIEPSPAMWAQLQLDRMESWETVQLYKSFQRLSLACTLHNRLVGDSKVSTNVDLLIEILQQVPTICYKNYVINGAGINIEKLGEFRKNHEEMQRK